MFLNEEDIRNEDIIKRYLLNNNYININKSNLKNFYYKILLIYIFKII